MKFKAKQHIIYALLFSFTLGLAPFTPEPHFYQKLKWLFSGAKGMQSIDYFDLVLHGLPWVYLLICLFIGVGKGY